MGANVGIFCDPCKPHSIYFSAWLFSTVFPIILSIISAIAPVTGHIAGRPETIHSDVKSNHQCLCRFIETQHGLQDSQRCHEAPPGTPGAATIVIPSMKIKPAKSGKSNGIPCIIINASAQATIFNVLPDRWMVAHSGITNPATSADTPFFLACSSVTGMVAADDCVPNAVK